MPSLQAPLGALEVPVEMFPRVVRSAAFHSETESPRKLVTRMRSPSNAIELGLDRLLPVSVIRIEPLPGRTTDTEFETEFGTQRFVPSKARNCGEAPTVTVRSTA